MLGNIAGPASGPAQEELMPLRFGHTCRTGALPAAPTLCHSAVPGPTTGCEGYAHRLSGLACMRAT